MGQHCCWLGILAIGALVLTIIAGVKAGDRLVLDGQSRLKPGSRVEVTADAPASSEMADRRSQP